jgi:hypothetical protein
MGEFTARAVASAALPTAAMSATAAHTYAAALLALVMGKGADRAIAELLAAGRPVEDIDRAVIAAIVARIKTEALDQWRGHAPHLHAAYLT